MLNEIIHQGNSFAETWAWWVATSILNATLVLTVVSLLWFAIRRKASPQLGYLLFLLVPLKLFVPLEIAVPECIGSWMPMYVSEAAKRLELTSLAEQTAQRTGESAAMIVGEQSTPTVVPSDASLPEATPEMHLPAASLVAPDHRSAAPALTSQLPSHPSVDPHSNVSLLAWLMLVWALGVLALLTRLVHAQFRFLRITRNANPVGPALPGVDFDGLLHRIRIGQHVRVVESAVISSPAVSGIFRPTLILPAGMMASLSTKHLEWVLLHELAHVRRRDLAVNCFQRLATILHFLNPAVWVANRMINRLREYACDDMASAYGNSSQVESGEAFLGVVRYAAAIPRRPAAQLAGSLGMFELTARASCFQRLTRLLDTDRRVRVKLGLGSVCVLLLTAALALPQIRAANYPAGDEQVTKPQEEQIPGGISQAVTQRKSEAKYGEEAAFHVTFELTVSGPDGKPVPRASVEIRVDPVPTAEQIQRGEFLRKSNYGAVVRTDANGHLVLELPKTASRLDVGIQEPGYGPYWAGWSSEEHPQSIPSSFVAELEAGWSIGGVVVDSQGTPMEGVTIHPSIKYKKRPDDPEDLGIGTQLTTDAEGKWRFDSVPISMNEVFVEMSHPDFMPDCRSLPRDKFGIQQGEQPVARIGMQRGSTVAGRVTDAVGKSISGALVRTKFFNNVREARTDAEGVYKLVGCPPDQVARIVASATGLATDMKQVRIQQDMDPVDFTMQPGGHVRIRVADADGEPIPKARIFFQQWRGRQIEYFEFDHVDQYADEHGVWEWNEAPLDEFQADICRPDGMQLGKQSIIAREQEYVFTPPVALQVTGRVIDAETRAAVSQFRVVPGWRESDKRLSWLSREAFGGRDGQFQWRETSSRFAHVLRVEAPGYLPVVSRDIQGNEGSIAIGFELRRGRDVAAQVLTPDGKPAAHAEVALGITGSQIMIRNGEFMESSTFCERQTATESGEFRFPPQENGFRLVVTHPAGFANLGGESGTPPTVVQLQPWARVEGTYRIGSRAAANVPLEINLHEPSLL